MKVRIKGDIRRQGIIEDLMNEIVNGMAVRLELPEGTSVNICDVEFKAKFTIDGEEKFVTVPREIDGAVAYEIFTVDVNVDEEGNILSAEDNEEVSEHDGFTLASSVGKEYKYTGTTSNYTNDELEVIESLGENTEIDVMSVRYSLKDHPGVEIVRHYKGDVLVAEYEYWPKDDTKATILDTEYEPVDEFLYKGEA